jgi:hypothetical protein
VPMRDTQIERRKPDLAAEFATVQNPATDHVRPAQQVLRPGEVAGSERCAHR